MFGFVKKMVKPVHEKYGRENYVGDQENFEANEEMWILSLSALFVEAMDIDLGSKSAMHDKLCFYDSDTLSSREKSEMNNEYFALNNKNAIEERVQEVLMTWSTSDEQDLYASINAIDEDDVMIWVNENHGGESYYEDKKEMCIEIFEEKEKYDKLYYHIGYIAESMWQIRLATVLNRINESLAWDYLYKMAKQVKVVISLFKTWEEYHDNLELFHEVHAYEYDAYMLKNLHRANLCFRELTSSPFHQVPIDLCVEKGHPYLLTSHTYHDVKRRTEYDEPTMIMLMGLLEQEDKSKLFETLHGLEGVDKEYYFPMFMDDAPKYLDVEDVLELPERYSSETYAYMIRGRYFYLQAWEARGNSISSEVGDENYELFYERLDEAVNDFFKAYELMPEESYVWANLYDIFSLIGEEENREKLYQRIENDAIRDPYCIRTISNYKQKRWGGNHQANIDWANQVIASSQRGDVCRLIAFEVAIERNDYISCFDKNEEKAEEIYKDKALQTELNQYFDELIENIHKAPYRIHRVLLYWYLMTNDIDRLRIIAHALEAGQYDNDILDEYTAEMRDSLLHWVRTI